MTNALVTQLLEALLTSSVNEDNLAQTTEAITAAREYLATEPAQWNGERSHLRFVGCPACGKRSCIACSCTTNEPTTRPLTLQERAEMESAGVTGELVKVLAFNDRPHEANSARASSSNQET